MISIDDCIDIFSALMKAPEECSDCVAFCQEGHISCPCNGDWNCENRFEEGETE